MSINACAAMVERGDPDRFLAAMAAPAELRGRLFVLYAFNLEVARAPWVTKEEMIAEMRLQWWRDVVEEAPNATKDRSHEVAGPLATLIRDQNLPIELLDQIIAARRWDIYRDPFEDQADMDRHLMHSAGNLMWVSALALDASQHMEKPARDIGFAMGIAAWLRAVAGLADQNRVPLVDGRPEGVRALAQSGLDQLKSARGAKFGAATPAIRAGWRSALLLKQAVKSPDLVADGTLETSELQRRGGLLVKTLLGKH